MVCRIRRARCWYRCRRRCEIEESSHNTFTSNATIVATVWAKSRIQPNSISLWATVSADPIAANASTPSIYTATANSQSKFKSYQRNLRLRWTSLAKAACVLQPESSKLTNTAAATPRYFSATAPVAARSCLLTEQCRAPSSTTAIARLSTTSYPESRIPLPSSPSAATATVPAAKPSRIQLRLCEQSSIVSVAESCCCCSPSTRSAWVADSGRPGRISGHTISASATAYTAAECARYHGPACQVQRVRWLGSRM